jgi:3-isopropylmalate/(R)-2-methylmalate dehydratase small subunit
MIHGTVHRYGDNVDTDAIIPARYLNVSDGPSLAAHCFEDADASFVKKVRAGDVVVAGRNFGCGSSREHAPIALKEAGISCVIAETFARIFYRNSINIGLPILECPAAAQALKGGDVVDVDLVSGRIVNTTTGKTYQAEPFPPFMMEIIAAGGLIAKLRADVRARR